MTTKTSNPDILAKAPIAGEGENAVSSAVQDNLLFLIFEVSALVRQVGLTFDGHGAIEHEIATREDYINNLKCVIENKTYARLGEGTTNPREVDFLRAINTVATNLERIADFAVNIFGQMRYLLDIDVVRKYGPNTFFGEITAHLAQIRDGLWRRDMSTALRLCRCEARVDRLYHKVFIEIMADLRSGAAPEDLVTALFIYRYLERMADSLLNIGEAIMLAALGERLKISHYEALESTFAAANIDIDLDALEYEGIWETRSGSRIATVHERGQAKTQWVIFKEGQTRKLVEEKQGIERWAKVAPEVPPRVIEFRSFGEHSSLLLEFIQGETFQQIVLDGDKSALESATASLLELLGRIWQLSFRREPTRPKFVQQLRRRLPEVFKIHPAYRTSSVRIGALCERGFEAMLDSVEQLDDELGAPFQVLLHGDLNADNVLIDVERAKVRMIDLHRCSHGDYLQDASVFLLSNHRMPVHELVVRRRIDWVCRQVLRFVGYFAQRHGDPAWQARLSLGLVRSFVSSTRFELDSDHAGSMFHRAMYLLNDLTRHAALGQDWAHYRLPADILQS